MTQKKGKPHHPQPHKDPRKARPGNKNTVKGPRVGRRDKPATANVAAPTLPQPRPGATLVRGPGAKGRPKAPGQGKDFAPGTNSHAGTVFRRTEDMLPRGNIQLNREVLDLTDWLANRIEGLPVKKIETTKRPPATFVLTQRDGTVTPLLPEKVGGGVTSAAVSAEDEIILDLKPVRL